MSVQVAQQNSKGAEWFSWGSAVQTTEATDTSIRFNCPWGVIGKALQVDCVLKFDKMADDGFDAVLTIESFQDDRDRQIRFTRITRDNLPATFTARETPHPEQAAPPDTHKPSH